MLEGDEYEDHLLGDPNQLDDIIEGRDLNQLEDEAENVGEEAGDEQGGEDEKKEKPKRTRVLNPQPKLDAIRLTGPRGVVAIEGLFKDFKFYGAGYEDQDLNRIMKRLELWGNRLFPKFQFDDLLERVEKLGHKRQVLNFVGKIRMGEVTEDSVAENPKPDDDVMDMDDDDLNGDATNNSVPNDDVFEQLLAEQQTQVNVQPTQSSLRPMTTDTVITDEQKERMMRNRLLAEERRLARIKAQQEKDLQIAESSAAPQIETVTEVERLADKGNEILPSPRAMLCDSVEDRLEESTDRNTENSEVIILNNSKKAIENIAETNSVMQELDSGHDENKFEISNQGEVEEVTEYPNRTNNEEKEVDLRDHLVSNIDVNYEVEHTKTCEDSVESKLMDTNVVKSVEIPSEDVEMKE